MSNTEEGQTSKQSRTERDEEKLVPIPEDGLILLPLRDLVAFPGTAFPLAVSRPKSIAAIQQAIRQERTLALVLQRDPAKDEPVAVDLYRIGCEASILRYLAADDGPHHLVCLGLRRIRVTDLLTGSPFPIARVQRIADPIDHGAQVEGRFLYLRDQAIELLGMLPQAPAGLVDSVREMTEPGALADIAAAYSDIPAAEKQEVLETIPLEPRLDKVGRIMAKRLEVLRITHEIGERTRQAFDARQREAVLREQMKTIRQKLGEDDDRAAEATEIRSAIDAAKMPPEAEAQALKELGRYERLPEGAAEAGMLRTWLEWMTEIPWAAPESPPLDVAEARRVLDADHLGLDKIKTRIVEFIAVRKLAPRGVAPVLCFVGPPGVGKTSLGTSVARAMGRPFVRVSLGGLHDEAEIRGHRRTYIGALPGNIVQSLRRAGRRDCVMMLDEIDKLGRGVQGDPAAALLEVLDPAQNSAFRDNYLGVDLDLSQVVFLTTANTLDGIPPPLLDRMEVIRLAGYTEAEKLEIAKRYLLPRQLEATGLSDANTEVGDDAIRKLIREYTREAGVRGLERQIGAILRHVAVRVAEGATETQVVADADLATILGPPRFENEVAMRTSLPGVATGLAWTPFGGDILFIEASRTPGKGALILTGQLGEVMRESAQAALTLVKARADRLGIDPAVFDRTDIHLHVPAGATPKDGPSAGVAMVVALSSLLTDRPVRSDTAMTGEISLRGLVLPVGGIKEKVLAAAAAGISRVLLPERNRKDLDDIPEDVRAGLEVLWLGDVDDARHAALEAEGQGIARKAI